MKLYIITYGLLLAILTGSVSCASNTPSKKRVSHFYPASGLTNTKAPLLFLFTGSGGGSWPRESKELNSLLNNGYHVVTIAYFGLPGLPENLSRIEIDPIIETIKKYKNRKDVVANCVGVVGGSKGGELVLLLGSLSKEINLVASITPSHVAFEAGKVSLLHHSSWMYHKEEIPFVPYPHFSPSTFKGIFSNQYLDMHIEALSDKEVEDQARIKVENINGPVFLLSAKFDEVWPSQYMAEQVIKRLEDNDFPFSYEHQVVNSGHYVLVEAPEGWSKLLAFVKRKFNGERCGVENQSVQ